MKTKTFPNGVAGNYTYFDNGDLQSLTYASGTAAPLLDLSYTYDNYSNIDTKTKDGVVYDYSYDNLYQLTGVTIPSATPQNESFSYDGVGNRLSTIDKPNWIYDGNNRLTNYNNNEVIFSYDNNGNTISKADASGTTSYNYSIDDRLLTVSTPTISASYQYDPMGRRIRKTVNGTTTKYLWDGYVMIAELNDFGNILKTYLYNHYDSEYLSMTENSNTYYFLNDHLMTPQKMVDSSGSIVWSAEYKAFGKVTIDSSSTITNNLRFPGQYYDSEIGLYYNIFRYFSPHLGRYITTDPINVGTIHLPFEIENKVSKFILIKILSNNPQILSNNPQMQHLYIYVINSPLNLTDPYGESVVALWVIATVITISITVVDAYTKLCKAIDTILKKQQEDSKCMMTDEQPLDPWKKKIYESCKWVDRNIWPILH